jgi:hypothetical protein
VDVFQKIDRKKQLQQHYYRSLTVLVVVALSLSL